MHEAGLAAAVASEIRNRQLDARFVRLRIHGGRNDAATFDQALRIHLALALREADVETMEIVHLPTPRLCVRCIGLFEAVAADTACPLCGGDALPVATTEWIDLECDSGQRRARPRVQGRGGARP